MRQILVACTAAALAAPVRPPSAQIACVRTHDVLDPIAFADAVVTGRVLEVSPEEVVLAVERRIVGGGVPDYVRVRRLSVEFCGIWRWAPYAVGQRVLTFLMAPDDAGDAWCVCGDTEWPLLADAAVVAGPRVEGYRQVDHPIGDGSCRGSLVAVEELAEAIAGFRAAFACLPEERSPTFAASIEIRDREAARALRESSRTGIFLYERALSSELFRPAAAWPPFLYGLPLLRAPKGSGDRSFGKPLAVVGDVDGDGVVDLAVGAAADAEHPTWGGALRLLFLEGDGSFARDVLLEGLPLLGSGIAPLGDLDRDGVPDVAVTARESFDDGERSVLVLFLTRDGRVRRSVELCDQDALRAIGVGADFDLGQGLAALGDLDGDGCPELVVGTRYPKPEGRSFFLARQTAEERRAREAEVRASAVVLFLDREGGVRRARAIGAFPVGLGDDGWGEPMTFAGVGDVNGDGTPDLAVGKPFTSYGGDFRGAVWIVPLRPDGEPLEGRRIVDLGEGELRRGKLLGRALAAPGDVDGDGVLDLLAAGSNALHVLFLDRDGGLKAHRAVSTEPWNGFKLHDPALACGRPVAQGAGVSLAVGGRRGDWRDDVGVVWLLAIGPDGDLRAR